MRIAGPVLFFLAAKKGEQGNEANYHDDCARQAIAIPAGELQINPTTKSAAATATSHQGCWRAVRRRMK
jgi:hypothetical protein